MNLPCLCLSASVFLGLVCPRWWCYHRRISAGTLSVQNTKRRKGTTTTFHSRKNTPRVHLFFPMRFAFNTLVTPIHPHFTDTSSHHAAPFLVRANLSRHAYHGVFSRACLPCVFPRSLSVKPTTPLHSATRNKSNKQLLIVLRFSAGMMVDNLLCGQIMKEAFSFARHQRGVTRCEA